MNEEINIEIISTEGNLNFIKLTGYINWDTKETLKSKIISLIEEKNLPSLAFDLSEVEYISSAGVSIFIIFKEKLEEKQGKMFLINPKKSFLKVFKILGFLPYFTFCDSFEEAKGLFNH